LSVLQIAIDRGYANQLPAASRPKPVGMLAKFFRGLAGKRI
jgi:hypothetical protein